MLKAKVPESVIIGQIAKANLRFNLSPQDVITLTEAGATESILRQMDPSIPASKAAEGPVQPTAVQPASPTEGDVKKIATDPNDPDTPHTPGLFLYTEKNGQRSLATLNKTVPETSRAKHSGVLGYAVFAFVPRPRADLRTNDHRPVFYFYVKKPEAVSGVDVNSPGQLTLILMEKQKIYGVEGRRFLCAKQSHPFSTPVYGTDPKEIVFFKSEQRGETIFRLLPDKELNPGEYCFFFSNGPTLGKGTAAANITLFDFGID
jgi:hypothetical protein